MSAARGWDRVRHWHREEWVRRFAARPLGQLLVWAVASGLVFLQMPQPPKLRLAICAAIALVQLWPSRRSEILSAIGMAILGAVFLRPAQLGGTLLLLAVLALFVLGSYRAAIRMAARSGRSQRHANLVLHVAFWIAVVALTELRWSVGPRSEIAVACRSILFLSAYNLFRLSYLLLSGRRGSARGTRLVDHLLYIFPAWGGSNVPLGKGHDYLSHHSAADREARVASQLGGLKCLVLGALWLGTLEAMNAWVYGVAGDRIGAWNGGWSLGVPQLATLIGTGGVGTPIGLRWASVVLELVRQTLLIALLGHGAVGCLRLFGFHVFRNTYKPLLSETILDFWNRFYFYFKELLVEFFFFPSYTRLFKRWPRCRIVTAVFAAAFVGNTYFHTVDPVYLSRLPEQGPWILESLSPSRLLYCALLAAGVSVSMLRQRRRRGHAPVVGVLPSGLSRVRRVAGVWLFYALIHIWATEPARLSFAQHTEFFVSLFGF